MPASGDHVMLTPAPGFDDPLAMLRACHGQILRRCDTLDKLVVHLRSHGLDDAARAAITDVRRYFATAARHHHADEEQDLFPLLRADPALVPLLEDLLGEHAHLETMWQQLESSLTATGAPHDSAGLEALVAEFNRLYRAHITRENDMLLPAASRLLPAAVLTVVGARMAARRGISP